MSSRCEGLRNFWSNPTVGWLTATNMLSPFCFMIRAHTETRCYLQSPFFPISKQKLGRAILFLHKLCLHTGYRRCCCRCYCRCHVQPAFLSTPRQVPTAAAAVVVYAVVVGVVAAPARSRLSALKPRPKRTYKYWIYFLGYYSTYSKGSAKFQ